MVERAAAQNLDLAEARARLTQSRAAVKAAGAALLPSADLTGLGSGTGRPRYSGPWAKSAIICRATRAITTTTR